ncbi:hypothetical protein B0T10DRAFT_611129 [Thelonectria olida]|uniref:Uncharacterized protein n=1 Tax=Thelonectria olida TaxID=1576542 RepID=A0A9P8VTX5_9HYPO|nr:hypothetical protein B0T10DRAFT_611129 [Thelonectria olida]
MLPVANVASVGPKVLPVVLAIGSATAAGGYVRSHPRIFDRYDSQNNPVQQNETVSSTLFPNCAPEARSKFFGLVLESIFA